MKVELATVIHIGTALETACTKLEGDGVLIFSADRILKELKATLDAPLPQSILSLIESKFDAFMRPVMIAHCQSLYRPCADYCANQIRKFPSSFHVVELARLWHPLIVGLMTHAKIAEVYSIYFFALFIFLLIVIIGSQ